MKKTGFRGIQKLLALLLCLAMLLPTLPVIGAADEPADPITDGVTAPMDTSTPWSTNRENNGTEKFIHRNN